LQQAVVLGKNEQQQLSTSLGIVNASDATVTQLITETAKLTSLPDVGDVFAWHWADLTIVVQPAIRDYRSALNSQITRLDSEVTKVSTYADNLNSNLPAWEALHPVSPVVGIWTGSMKGPLGPIPMSLTITEQNGVFTISDMLNGPPAQQCTLVSIRGNVVSFRFGTNGSYFNGQVSADHNTLTGDMSGSGFINPWPCTLTKTKSFDAGIAMIVSGRGPFVKASGSNHIRVERHVK